ncbi:non-hydrolyzing UDP-N-acetylglucosamine 2-epimerase [Paenibacillus gansuensis]|uniref:Non-hydrolyzing UDP-N-acetylglucosamine 2-epimerase n=1 Tax=Paenibacillus gansuensis TaxID=306542 RepID=A0ABW5PK03_9BACL
MKVMTVIGARPQFVKAASLSRALRPHLQEILVHTGQHYDRNMSAVFFDQLRLPEPDYYLGIGSGTHGRQTARMLEQIEELCLKELPDLVLVYGDTNSTLAGSLAASKLHIPIAHVESGLRSFNRRMPEEINRVLTDHLSTLLFCPTQAAVANLKRESITNGVYLSGDVMYDTVLYYKEVSGKQSKILQTLRLIPKTYYLATIHRAENTTDRNSLEQMILTLQSLGYPVVMPLHPRTKKLIADFHLDSLIDPSVLRIIEPLPYLDMLALECQAKLILTDSGGVQKEAYMLQVPCITLRSETEWIETVQEGWNHVTGMVSDQVRQTIANLTVPEQSAPVFGQGDASERIAEVLCSFLT